MWEQTKDTVDQKMKNEIRQNSIFRKHKKSGQSKYATDFLGKESPVNFVLETAKTIFQIF